VDTPNHSPMTVSATFGDLDAARDAALAVERAGIDAVRVQIEGIETPTSPAEVHRSDSGALGPVAWRVLRFGMLGAAVGLVGALVFAVAGADGGPVVAAALGGAFAGFVVGGLLGLFIRLPVNRASWDSMGTNVIAPNGPYTVRVAAPDAESAVTARQALDGTTGATGDRPSRT